MKRPDPQMIEPGRLRGAGSGEAGVHCEVNGEHSSRHCPTSIDHAELMLGFAREAETQFHARYFAKMAAKFLLSASAQEVADARLDGIRRQWNDFVLSGGRA